MQFIKNAIKQHGAKGAKYVLHQQMRGWQPGRSHKVVHASSVTKGGTGEFCPREYAIRDVKEHKTPDEFLDTSHAMTFDIGRMVERRIIERLSDAGAAITNWRCETCKWPHDRCKRPQECVKCGCKMLKPEEIRLQSPISGISGGVDVFLQTGEPLLRITEIKTMAPEEFKKLVAPLAEHKLRTALYLRLAAESDDPWKHRINLQQANVLYVSKGGFGTLDPSLQQLGLKDKFSPFKEFVVSRDDSLTETLHQRSVRLKQFREGLKGMPVGICPTAFAKRAQACICTAACWSGEYPPSMEE